MSTATKQRTMILRRLRQTNDRWRGLATMERKARERRDATIRDAIAAGVSLGEIAKVTGLSRQRVHQIKEETQ